MRIAFLGFGLISGSIARALRVAADPRWRGASLTAWSPSGSGPTAAVRDGVLDEAAADAAMAVRSADLVILGAAPLGIIELLHDLGGPLGRELAGAAIVTDVGSTKAAIVAAAEQANVRFVGGHPMAGREQTGYAAAMTDLFVDRPWIVVPAATTRDGDSALVEELARTCGARPLTLNAAEHDTATAAISHLPLVLAAALVEAVVGIGPEPRPGWGTASQLAASGWRDMTRLARGDVAMAAGIAATNAGPLAERVRAVRDVLESWLADLERATGPDPDRLAARLRAVRNRLLERPPG